MNTRSLHSVHQRDAKKRWGPPHVYGNDSYDMDGIVMPLHEYINHHVAMGIVHNGARFQKTTKNLQQCLQMWLVHKLFPSYWNQLYIIIMHHQIPSSFDSSIDTINDQDNSSSIIESKSENMTVGKLMETYETCISTLRSSQSQRRIASLKRISPANFTKEKQHQIMEQKVHDSVTPGFNSRRSGR